MSLPARPKILVADDERLFRDSLAEFLRMEQMDVTTTGDGADALRRLEQDDFDLLISDMKMPGMDGMGLLRAAQAKQPGLSVILVTAFGTVESAIEAMKLGAADYVLKPPRFDDLILKVHRCLQYRKLRQENRRLRQEVERKADAERIVGGAQPVQDLLSLVQKVAQTRSNVLIVGESGTGKELVARAIHASGITDGEPFVPVNCGGIPETLFESEMFGHRRGAFTGAVRDKIGFFEAANGGTLFLDEIANLSTGAQMALLRAIEQKAAARVGDTRLVQFDLRVVSATNRELNDLVREGVFRDDLYFRLNVVQINLPPLRQRREDIPMLVEHFIRKYNREMNRTCTGIRPDALAVLSEQTWRGNVRELENVIERALIFAGDREIIPGDLPFFSSLLASPRAAAPLAAPPQWAAADEEQTENLDEAWRDFERRHIARVLAAHDYAKSAAADSLGISLPTLYRKISELGLPLNSGD